MTTVAELIEMLKELPLGHVVHLEGCDCSNKATRPILYTDINDVESVLIGADVSRIEVKGTDK